MTRLALICAACLASLAPMLAFAEEYGPVEVELRGQTQTWTETRPVLETTDDAKFQKERYGRDFSYVLTGLPPGMARLKLGFCELKYRETGERVFDIVLNDETLFENFDILEWGGPDEAVVVSTTVRVPENGSLTLGFRGKVENAKISFFKLYTTDWSLEIGAGDGPELLLGTVTRDSAHMHNVYETAISRFGSRICINPRPQKGLCRQTALGHADYNVAYFEKDPALYEIPKTAVYYGVGCGTGEDKVWYSLPFNGRLRAFREIRQEQTLTSLTYTCKAPDLPLEVTYRFQAPFYPRNLKLSCAPYILLDVSVRNLSDKARDGSIVVGHSPRATETVTRVDNADCLGVAFDLPVFGKQTTHAWFVDPGQALGVSAHAGTMSVPAAPGAKGESKTDADGRKILNTAWADNAAGLQWDFALAPGSAESRTFAYVGWVQEPILEVMHEPYHFKYVDLFSDIYDVARYAFDNRAEIDRKVALFESTVADASLSPETREFLAYAFQSWAMNTFYCTSEEGEDWFSVWEGCCKFHSTVDVEYNVAPLYFEYWPDLMKMTLKQWVNYIREGVLSHDMGMGLSANGMKYGHDMEVEENTNFVLLLHHYWRQTADGGLVRELFPHVEELLAHVIRCDTDGDGFHEEGTYNTIDQGSAAIQYAKDQTYLAVRALAAFRCGEQMADLLNRDDLATEWRRQARLIARTLDEQAWLDDHYAVTLNQPPKQYEPPAQDPWRRTPPAQQEDMWNNSDWQGGGQFQGGTYGGYGYQQPTYKPVQGWDGYSIYASNGLLYPMRSGLKIPEINLERMRRDIETSTLATLKQYGSPHSDRENNMWVSQNIWRDMAAAYLGMDMGGNMERYQNLQRYINRDKRGCFTDVYVYGSDHISLDYYPRGTAAFGIGPALAGLQVDRAAGKVSVAPVRDELRIPLLAYADWNAGKVPWLNLTGLGEMAQVTVEGELPVEVTTRAQGSPW